MSRKGVQRGLPTLLASSAEKTIAWISGTVQRTNASPGPRVTGYARPEDVSIGDEVVFEPVDVGGFWLPYFRKAH